jgi:proline racemase
MELDFIKGHMGGNTIILLDGRQVPDESDVLETALKVLDRLHLCADQAGFIYPSKGENCLRALIVDITNRDFIPACGGFTQVLGRALVDTDLASRFGITLTEPLTKVTLELASGKSSIGIHIRKGSFVKVVSDMTSFARMLFEDGVAEVDLDGIKAFKSGYYLVQGAEELLKNYPEADFEEMNQSAVKAVSEAQAIFHQKKYSSSLHLSLYDTSPRSGSDLRAVFPHGITTGNIEPTCGTGSTALALALLVTGEGEKLGLVKDNKLTVKLETGGDPVIGGPDITTVEVRMQGSEVSEAAFSHSFTEITAQGKISVWTGADSGL